ncbi:hypothetical protein ACFSKI_16345 [Pseudogracilibacillus auburnensis]|uniref:DUF7832 domain-containing protein n=1 Tax=Pseudogracilibacillus auburnensis TaxID=1494959 RepID=A0A2V3W5R7_9BACI|nr:hypothetical protein [Pseudogracilibacillus auburnensis]PXW89462.1 hypothetical protein DFR56_102239 [Pseudogracilibacillus auburnensis]
MSEIIVYDKAKYHYEGDFPNDLSLKQAYVHTGMFLGWLIDHQLLSKEFETEMELDIQKFIQREITGAEIYRNADGVLADDMLNEEANQFAMEYFDFENGLFLDDYEEAFSELDSLYEVEDSWGNYSKIKAVIDRRYMEWKHTFEKGSEGT